MFLLLFPCFLVASDDKNLENKIRVTMYQGFVDLLKKHPGKTLNELESIAWSNCTKNCSLELFTKNLRYYEAEHEKMPRSIAQMHAIFRLQMLCKEVNEVLKKRGVSVDETYGEVSGAYFQYFERMNK